MNAAACKPSIVFLLISTVGISLYGCVTTSDSSADRPNAAPGRPGTTIRSAESRDGAEPVATLVDARPAALINGRPVTWGDLRPAITDLGGAEALQELILDQRISAVLLERSITLGPDAAVAERKVLLESLHTDSNTAIRLLEELRHRQRLGKNRFESLLLRNAGLRALVRDQVRVTGDAVRTMHELIHGPKRQARLMVMTSLSEAEAAINLVKSGASFADVAVEMSTDTSAARGGLLEPISRADPAYPEAMRQTLWTLNLGEMSGPILLDGKYAVVMLLKRQAEDGVQLDDVRPALERAVRIQQERILMDDLARRMLDDAAVTIFDQQLNESWKRSKRSNE